MISSRVNDTWGRGALLQTNASQSIRRSFKEETNIWIGIYVIHFLRSKQTPQHSNSSLQLEVPLTAWCGRTIHAFNPTVNYKRTSQINCSISALVAVLLLPMRKKTGGLAGTCVLPSKNFFPNETIFEIQSSFILNSQGQRCVLMSRKRRDCYNC